MIYLLVLLAVCGLAACVFLSRFPKILHASMSREMNVSASQAYQAVLNLHTWPKWSPWLLHEPEAELSYSENPCQEGGSYAWKGRWIGSGRLRHVKLKPEYEIRQELLFIKPFRSKAEVIWSFESLESGGVRVTWKMLSVLPFLMRWMHGQSTLWLNNDFEIGLNLLSQHLGDQSSALHLSFSEKEFLEESQYIAQVFEGNMDDLPGFCKLAFSQIMDEIRAANVVITGEPMVLYRRIDVKKKYVCCDVAIPVESHKELVGFVRGYLPAQYYFRTRLKGAYGHLGLAWHAAFSHMRMIKIKEKQGIKHPSIERYVHLSSPESEDEAVTYIDVPVQI